MPRRLIPADCSSPIRSVRNTSCAAGWTGLAEPRGSGRGPQHAGCGSHQVVMLSPAEGFWQHAREFLVLRLPSGMQNMELHPQYVGRHLQVSRQGLGKNGVEPRRAGFARLSGWQPVGNWVASAANFPASLLPVGVIPTTSRRIATRSLRRKMARSPSRAGGWRRSRVNAGAKK
jgi:hypothetical protein